MTRENDDRQFGLALLDGVENFETVHLAAVKPYVEQHEARTTLVDCRQGRITVPGRATFIALVAQDA